MPFASQDFDCGHVPTIPANLAEAQDTKPDPGSRTSALHVSRPLTARCPLCICHAILEASLDGVYAVPHRYLADMDAYMRIICLSGNVSDEMRRQIYLLRERVWYARDVDELRRGVVALAGYFEVSTWFRL